MPFVLDASVALAWLFVDEAWPTAEALGRRAVLEGLAVPSYFHLEVGSGVLSGERNGRIERAAVERFLQRLSRLRFEVSGLHSADSWNVLVPLARLHGLKLFDAGYLQLAISLALPLATFDEKLRRAAHAAGVPLLES